MLVVETVAKFRREHFGRGKGVKTIAREPRLSLTAVAGLPRGEIGASSSRASGALATAAPACGLGIDQDQPAGAPLREAAAAIRRSTAALRAAGALSKGMVGPVFPADIDSAQSKGDQDA